MSTALPLRKRPTLAPAAEEFVLATVMLFLAVTIVRWLREPGSRLYIADLDTALGVIGVLSGAILTGLILSPLGKRSGGHLNPAVTVSLWLLGAFPGRSVAPYTVAQLAGSAAGTALARGAWGSPVSAPSVGYAAIVPAPGWQPTAVFLAEAGSIAAIMLAVACVAQPRHARLVPYLIGAAVALVIALLGPRSGGSINPARQLGPAVLSGRTADLWIYLLAPILGAALGVGMHRTLGRLPLFTRKAGSTASEHPENAFFSPSDALEGEQLTSAIRERDRKF
ncbi:hypothetical protein GCM10017744_077760 [Streptomyces antimycoticus]|uniref:Glycerol uptake facilitator protein n=1 Tax=Streptomyces antimycoticus TaxID=68175 RepID=A0A4D4K070_9ACTN|nr:aquaporin [Streptomyces antimycoticus]GDY41482.1 hypothetical protein SANT12839_023640 [Streptomyces antimycoticus]